METLRTQKVGEYIRSELGRIMMRDLDIPPTILITVTRVDVAPDLNNAKVFITVLPDNKRGTAVEYLNKNSGQLRTSLAKVMSAFKTPRLKFELDEKEIYGSEIDKILGQVKDDLK